MESDNTPKPLSRRSRKGQRTQHRLLEAARSVFEERGYFETKVTDIVERGEIALGSFYRYCTNKDELLLVLLEDVIAELYQATQGIWDQTQDPLTNLERTTASYLAAYKKNGRLIRALLQMSAVSSACAVAWWELRQRTYHQMAEHLPTTAAADGSPDRLVSVLGGMVEQFARYWYVEAPEYGHPEPDPTESSKMLAWVWYQAVYGQPGVQQFEQPAVD